MRYKLHCKENINLRNVILQTMKSVSTSIYEHSKTFQTTSRNIFKLAYLLHGLILAADDCSLFDNGYEYLILSSLGKQYGKMFVLKERNENFQK